MNKDVVSDKCWGDNGIPCYHFGEDEDCYNCVGYKPYRTGEVEGRSYFSMVIGSEIAKYQIRIGGRLHPREVIEGLETLLRGWRMGYGEHGFEKEPVWCKNGCGWYCDCRK